MTYSLYVGVNPKEDGTLGACTTLYCQAMPQRPIEVTNGTFDNKVPREEALCRCALSGLEKLKKVEDVTYVKLYSTEAALEQWIKDDVVYNVILEKLPYAVQFRTADDSDSQERLNTVKEWARNPLSVEELNAKLKRVSGPITEYIAYIGAEFLKDGRIACFASVKQDGVGNEPGDCYISYLGKDTPMFLAYCKAALLAMGKVAVAGNCTRLSIMHPSVDVEQWLQEDAVMSDVANNYPFDIEFKDIISVTTRLHSVIAKSISTNVILAE